MFMEPGIDSEGSIPPGWESIPELLKRFTNTGSAGYICGWNRFLEIDSLKLISGLLKFKNTVSDHNILQIYILTSWAGMLA
jgi:hypothetical protein